MCADPVVNEIRGQSWLGGRNVGRCRGQVNRLVKPVYIRRVYSTASRASVSRSCIDGVSGWRPGF